MQKHRSAIGAAGLVAAAVTLSLQVSQSVATSVPVACNTTDLKAAIDTANATSGPDTLQLAPGCTYTLTTPDNHWYGPNGLPEIASDITVEGNGSTIERSSAGGTPEFRLLYVGADPADADTFNYPSPGAGRLVLREVSLRGGFAKGGDSTGGGGGAGMGGAIFNQGKAGPRADDDQREHRSGRYGRERALGRRRRHRH